MGNLSRIKSNHGGSSSLTHGYITGGSQDESGLGYDDIEKFLFATDGNSTDVGNLTQGCHQADGTQN